MKEYLELGQIVNTRGLRGEVKVNSFSEDPKRFEKLKKIIVKNKQGNTEYEIERVGYSKNQVILKLKGIDHIDYAEKVATWIKNGAQPTDTVKALIEKASK